MKYVKCSFVISCVKVDVDIEVFTTASVDARRVNTVINYWNSLPVRCINFNTVSTFKSIHVSTAQKPETNMNS